MPVNAAEGRPAGVKAGNLRAGLMNQE